MPWHCSRDVSRLFTATNFEYETADTFLDPLPQDLERYEWHEKPFCRTAGMKFSPPEKIYSDLDGVNEVVYNS